MNNENFYNDRDIMTAAAENLLNAGSCGKDGIGKYDESDMKAVIEDVCSAAELLPPEGVEPFFKSDECLLCKGEHKKKITCYARVMLGHVNDNAGDDKAKTGIASKRRYRRRTGMIIPVQIAACDRCKSNLSYARYLPICTGLLISTLALALTSVESVRIALEGYGKVIPFLVFLIIACIGVLVAALVSKGINAKIDRESIKDPAEVPGMRKLLDRGWFVIKNAQEEDAFIFAKERMRFGLCTGDGQAEAIAAITGHGQASALQGCSCSDADLDMCEAYEDAGRAEASCDGQGEVFR